MKKIFLLALILIFISSYFLFFRTQEPKEFVTNRTQEFKDELLFSVEITRYPAKLSVMQTEKIGISTETFLLDFGILPKNLSARKSIELSNKDERIAKINLKVYGNITPFIEITPNNFILKENESKSVAIKAKALNVGNFTGEIQVIAKKSKFKLLEGLLPWI